MKQTRVLIVDDEASVRTFAQGALQFAGYETAVAGDGSQALRIWNDQGPFDLLLADVVMPGIAGNELARQLRLLDPDLKVLYFTGYSDRLFTDRTTLWQNEAFVEKPVNMRGLLEAVSLMVSGHVEKPQSKQSSPRRRRREAPASLPHRFRCTSPAVPVGSSTSAPAVRSCVCSNGPRSRATNRCRSMSTPSRSKCAFVSSALTACRLRCLNRRGRARNTPWRSHLRSSLRRPREPSKCSAVNDSASRSQWRSRPEAGTTWRRGSRQTTGTWTRFLQRAESCVASQESEVVTRPAVCVAYHPAWTCQM